MGVQPSHHVALLGAPGSGKTTLARALGAVPDGAPGRLGIGVLPYAGVRLVLLDAPGGPDAVAAQVAALRVADAALFVLAADGGTDAATAQAWAACETAGLPRAVVVTGLDRPRADFDEAVALCQRLFDDEVLPLHLPMHDDDGGVAGLIDLLDQSVVDLSSGTRVVRAADPEHVKLIATLRGELVELVLGSSDDGDLLDRYLDGEEPPADRLAAELRAAVGQGLLCPALAVVPATGVGLPELLDLLTAAFPGPDGRPLPAVAHADGSPGAPLETSPDGPLVAEVVRVVDGRADVLVRSGVLRSGPVAVGGRVVEVAVEDTPAGSLVTVEGLGARTGDTLSSPADPMLLAAWPLPDPLIATALSASDDAALDKALDRLLAEDPVVQVERRDGRLVVWTLGGAHTAAVLAALPATAGEVAADRRTVDGVEVEPWWALEVAVPTVVARTVTSELRGRGAQALATAEDPEDDETSVVHAEVSETVLLGLSGSLRRASSGTAVPRRSPLGDRPV